MVLCKWFQYDSSRYSDKFMFFVLRRLLCTRGWFYIRVSDSAAVRVSYFSAKYANGLRFSWYEFSFRQENNTTERSIKDAPGSLSTGTFGAIPIHI